MTRRLRPALLVAAVPILFAGGATALPAEHATSTRPSAAGESRAASEPDASHQQGRTRSEPDTSLRERTSERDTADPRDRTSPEADASAREDRAGAERDAPARQDRAAPVRVSTVALGSASRPAPGVAVARVQPGGIPVDGSAALARQPGPAAGPVTVLQISRPHTGPFSSVGVTWRDDPGVGPVSVAVRSRPAGRTDWSGWLTSAGDEGDVRGARSRPAAVRGGAGLVWTGPAHGVEVAVTSLGGRAPADVRVDLIDPGVGLKAPLPAPATHGTVVDIRSRSAWGADPRLMTWKPEYTAGIRAVVVHHTATGNTYTADQVPGILRSIYRYHAVSQGWGDIGYHILVDRFGRAWEGRYGGVDRSVIGAHAGGFNRHTAGIAFLGNSEAAAPPEAAQETIARAIAFKLGGSRVRPTATTMLTGGPSSRYPRQVTLKVPTVYPHQLTSRTACPGGSLLAALPALRERADDLVDGVPPNPEPPAGGAGAAVRPAPLLRAATAEPGWVAVPAAGLTLHGKGLGHGRGMSQYGARGAATRGRTAQAILAHYYPGTRSTRIGARTVRTRLTAGDGGSVQFAPVAPARTVTGLVATAPGGRRVALPSAARYRVHPDQGGYVVQRPAGRGWATVATLTAPVRFSGPATLRMVFGQRKSGCKRGAEATWAGSADAVVHAGRSHYLAVQPLETYLRGVVSSEMPSTWPAAALQAQSVAARSYAVSRLVPSRFYDVVDTVADQCWDGAASERASTNAAIAATAGLIRTYAGRVINAQFSSDNGGWSAPGGPPYLPSRADPFSAAGRSPYLNWQVTLSGTQLAAADGPDGLTEVTAVRVTARDGGGGAWGGRVTTVQISGRTATGRSAVSTVSGTHFRFRLGLRSTYLGFAPA